MNQPQRSASPLMGHKITFHAIGSTSSRYVISLANYEVFVGDRIKLL